MVACAENMGVHCGSGMFGHALHAVACFSKEEIAARVDYLKNMFMWTDAEVAIAVSKAPLMLTRSKESMQRSSEFLISKVGLEPAYIARRPAVLTYSLEGRLRPPVLRCKVSQGKWIAQPRPGLLFSSFSEQ
uniref:Uncharacterized protein n=1 Tax=Triticum urartu TaxID=4572 RepID=A0A8R7USH8_TRIUA